MRKTTEQQTDTTALEAALPAADQLSQFLSPLLEEMGYELVHLEVQNHRQKTLRVYIDRLAPGAEGETAIGIEDCVVVTKALDAPLDSFFERTKIFSGTYELEVSSPGVDRPLRKERDYEKFCGREVRIHTFRPLTGEEASNRKFSERHPKQKTFYGQIQGLDSGNVLLKMLPETATKKKGAKVSSKPKAEDPESKITIPLSLISKANLEPRFE